MTLNFESLIMLTTARTNLIDMKDFSIEISLVHHSLHCTSGVVKCYNECAGNKFPGV